MAQDAQAKKSKNELLKQVTLSFCLTGVMWVAAVQKLLTPYTPHDAPDVTGSLVAFLQRNAHTSGQGRNDDSSLHTNNFHTVYQIACSAFSLHQAIALDWSWRAVHQPGQLTRIVCGCNLPADKDRMMTSPLSGDVHFKVFFTRDWNIFVAENYEEAHSDDYKVYNKPFGFKDWLSNSKPLEEYIMFVDPDMVFIRPILYHLGNESMHERTRVSLGHPVAQSYFYVRAHCGEGCNAEDPGWMDFAQPGICGAACPSNVTEEENRRHYAAGLPTIMHKKDWESILPLWCNFSVWVRTGSQLRKDSAWLKKGQRVYIAEMLAYSLAAATLGLRHRLLSQIATDALDECMFSPLFQKTDCSPPHLIHYCYPQNAETPYGRWIWNKYRMPLGFGLHGPAQWGEPLFWQCDMPLLDEPPRNALESSSWDARWQSREREKHVMWMIIKIINAYNEGHHNVKKQRCMPAETIEDRKLLRVTEDLAYIPGESLVGDPRPLQPRITRFVKRSVTAKGWTPR